MWMNEKLSSGSIEWREIAMSREDGLLLWMQAWIARFEEERRP